VATYVRRIVDTEVEAALASIGAVALRGARAVGKTETALQVAASVLRLDIADPRARLARVQPETALPGDTPRLLDEWSLVPALWNEVRHEVDRRQQVGQFILTGSTWPNEEVLRHSGAGRFRHITMRTMTLSETGHSNGIISLASLLSPEALPAVASEQSFRDVIARLVVGGWPGWWQASETEAAANLTSYVADISEHHFPEIAGQRRDPRRLRAFLQAIAGLQAQPSTFVAVTRRINAEASLSVSSATVPELFDFASRLYLVEDQPAWSPQLRSPRALLQTPKRHLTDPSLAAALLGARSDRLLVEPVTLGHIFESQVVHDLRVYAQVLSWRGVFHFRDAKGRDEIDAVVEADDGRWIGVEAKLGASAVDAGAANLIRVAAKITRPPSALMVIIPTGVAHRRSDGVLVVPLSLLGP